MDRWAMLSIHKNQRQGLVEFATELLDLGFGLIASSGTTSYLNDNGIAEVVELKILNGHEPMFGHRMATISWEYYCGLLARNLPEDRAILHEKDWPWIDLLNVAVYPLAATIANRNSTLEQVIEEIDIGGPTSLCAAAKGGRWPLWGIEDRAAVLDCLRTGEKDRDTLQRQLAGKVFGLVGEYYSIAGQYMTDYPTVEHYWQ